MKRTSTLKRGGGFKNKGSSFKRPTLEVRSYGLNKLKKSSFKRTPTDTQKEVRETDSKFSKFIINRDQKCLRCGTTQMLTCSHFHGRANYATRFEPSNCVTFCVPCHDIFESKKSGAYMDWMLAWLGEKEFFVLDTLSKMKISKADAIKNTKNLLLKVGVNNDIKY